MTSLPIKKANDGIIDCLGATDEPRLCRSQNEEQKLENFYCIINNRSSCISHQNLCDNYQNCDYNDDEQACDIDRNLTIYGGICFDKHRTIRSDIEQFLCQRLNENNKQRLVDFSLDIKRNLISQTTEQEQKIISSSSDMIKPARSS